MFLRAVLAVATAVVWVWLYHHFTQEDAFISLTAKLNSSYDFIIVGAGSAGCVLANRLSEDGHVTVLLLEAGPDDRKYPKVTIPGLADHQFNTETDWGYLTEPQQFAMHGLVQNVGYHGRGGPLKVTSHKTLELTDLILQAGRDMGLKEVDPNGETMEGVAQLQFTLSDGVRYSTSRAFLYPVLHRNNLHVVTDAHVTKVVFEGQRAVGVNLVRHGRKEVVGAGREVIVSAGAVGSPHLLQLSGLGPKPLLDKLQIPVVADLPVGDNLQEHPAFDYQVGVRKHVTVTPEELTSVWARLKYTLFKSGPWSSPMSVENAIFRCTEEDSDRKDWPDLELIFMGRLWNTEHLRGTGHTKEAIEDAKRRDTFQYGFPCVPVLLRPKSRGTLRLRSADPFDYPAIDPHYLENPEDLAHIVRGVRVCQKLVATPTMQSVGAEATDPPSQFCAQHTFDTDDYWACVVRRNTMTMYHACGTCKMGAVSDNTTVVDPQLRVKGVQGLRVVDASIMPNLPTGQINAPVLMVAEKAADIIKADYRHP
ncbi:hypothetical protein ACOMHN_022012 [Nucella lapillus]